MWKHVSDVLSLQTKMTSKQTTGNWIEEYKKVHEHMDKAISRVTLLVCSNLNEPFVILVDTSKIQIGAVISQGKQSNSFL